MVTSLNPQTPLIIIVGDIIYFPHHLQIYLLKEKRHLQVGVLAVGRKDTKRISEMASSARELPCRHQTIANLF